MSRIKRILAWLKAHLRGDKQTMHTIQEVIVAVAFAVGFYLSEQLPLANSGDLAVAKSSIIGGAIGVAVKAAMVVLQNAWNERNG